MSDLILWSDAEYTSPWAHSVWMALKEKGLEFSLRVLDIETGENRKGDYAHRTLTGKIPSLQHESLWITESSAIIEYLEERFPPPGYPAVMAGEPAARARDREICSWLRSDLFELRRCMPYEGLFVARSTPEITDKATDEAAKVVRVAAARWSQGAPRAPTIADLELTVALHRPMRYGVPVDAKVREIAEAIWKRPSCDSWVRAPRPG